MGLVAASAVLMPCRRGPAFFLVAVSACGAHLTTMGLVTARTLGVPFDDLLLRCLVTFDTSGGARRRLVGQSLVAALAVRVVAEAPGNGHLLGVASATCGQIRQRALEVVRCVALLAVRAAMVGAFRVRFLVTAAAVARAGVTTIGRWVGIVTAHASSRVAFLRVVGLLVLMTVSTRSVRAVFHVMGVVATVAAGVIAHPGGAYGAGSVVAAGAQHRFSLAETMGLMAGDAFLVTFE